MATSANIPKFGLLEGLKVVDHGQGVMGSFGASIMAEHGANVLHIEDAKVPDISRSYDPKGYAFRQERRNMLDMALDVTTEEGKAILLRLLRDADVLMESQGGGVYADLGLTDEVLWESNPALVIVHVSPFGQTGDDDVVRRPGPDSVVQAYSGVAIQNGLEPPNPPLDARPQINAYQTALFAMASALAGYIERLRTGKGESVDLAAYEIGWKTQYSFPIEWIMDDTKLYRTGNVETSMVGLSNYRCADDKYVFLALGGATPLHKTLALLGLEGEPEYPPDMQYCIHGTPGSERFYEALKEFCLSKPAAEIEGIFGERGIPCSMIYDTQQAASHPQVVAREVFCEWDDPVKGAVKGVNVIPKVAKNVGQIWRGAPSYGMDNNDILREIGYSDAEIDDLYNRGIVNAAQA